jgi:hypothetical protein
MEAIANATPGAAATNERALNRLDVTEAPSRRIS